MTLTFLWLQLIAAALVVLISAKFLTRSADIIAEKTGLGRSFVGVVMLATATSIPELGIGISSIALLDVPDLAAGDAFGTNLVNLAIVGILDTYWRNGPILNSVNISTTLIAGLTVAITSLAVLAILIHKNIQTGSEWFLSPISLIILGVFITGMYMGYKQSISTSHEEVNTETSNYDNEKLLKSFTTYFIATAIIVVASVLLAKTGEGLAHEMGWEASFVGTQFLAISTSLPELATSIAAVRLNAPELAITNLLGSNMFNHGVVLFADDAAYTSGPLWDNISQIHSITGLLVLLMTSFILVGLIWRPRQRLGRYWTPESVGLMMFYIISSVLIFKLA